tara:strand:+ start:708 stop:968 length:261 start_codon:yes stop_codon:yes gene_type:complete
METLISDFFPCIFVVDIGLDSYFTQILKIRDRHMLMNAQLVVGEISAKLLTDSGIMWTLVGHSERRAGFGYPGESNAVVGMKMKVN